MAARSRHPVRVSEPMSWWSRFWNNVIDWITHTFYPWLWHDVLHLRAPISVIIVESVKSHLGWWDLCGCIVLSILWILTCHFVAME